MTTQMNRPDFAVVVNELIKGLHSETSETARALFGPDERPLARRALLFRELRTIGFSSGRQSGMSQYVVELLASQPDVLCVVKDLYAAKSLFTRVRENPKSDMIGDDEYFKRHIIVQRFIKSDENFGELSPLPELAKNPPRTIVVDDAASHYHFFRLNLLHWLAVNCEPDPVIILVG